MQRGAALTAAHTGGLLPLSGARRRVAAAAAPRAPRFALGARCTPLLAPRRPCRECQRQGEQQQRQRRAAAVVVRVSPFDQAWGTQIDGQSLASQLFAASLFPYLGFLWHLTRSGKAPRLVLFGFYFLLAFVGATIPAGIYAKSHYGTSLANVDWLHGGAESLLTITNLFLVLGLRQAIREAEAAKSKAGAKAAEAAGPEAPAEAAGGGKPGGDA
ncbi:MAG: hypothetical protein J3K34DRAFT_445605 [Monoraphidium minutum]|nr:MAG: hypothetical protein J3K34DRAFT_445605 [Monoraphidium minutum]